MSSIGTAFVDVALDPKSMEAQLGALSGRGTGLFKKIGGGWGAAAATGFGAAIAAGVGAGKALYEIGAQFDDMSDTIRKSTGATGKDLDRLSKAAMNVGKTVPASFEDAGKAVSSVSTRLGLTGKPLEKVSQQMIELAQISGTDLPTALNSLTRMLGDAGVKGAGMSKALDEIFRASEATGVPVGRLSDLMTKFGGPMRQLGFSFEQEAAMLGKFEKEGVNTELVMGSMRIALGKMAKAGKDPVEALRQTMQSIKDTGDAGKANAQAIELFGARAGPDMAAAIREGRFSIDDLVGTISKGRDTIHKAATDTYDFSEQWQMFKNQVAVGLEPIASKLFSGLGQGMAALNREGPGVIATLKQQMGPAIEALAPRFQPVVDAITGSLIPALQSLGPIFVDLKAIIVALTPVWQAMADTIVNRITTVIGVFKGLVEVVGGVVKIIRGILTGDWGMAWDGVKQVVQGAVDAVKAVLTGMVNQLRIILGLAGTIAKAIGEAIWKPIDTAATAVARAAQRAGEAIVNGLRSGASKVGSVISGVIRGAISAVTGAATALGSAAVHGIASGISDGVAAVKRAVASVKSAITGAFKGAASWLYDAGVQLVAGLAKGITDKAEAAIGAVKNLGSQMKHAITSGFGILSPSKVTIAYGEQITLGLAVGITNKTPQAVQAAVTMSNKVIAGVQGSLKSAAGNLGLLLTQAFEAKQAQIVSPAQALLDKLQAQQDAAQKQAAVQQAKAGLVAAGGDDQAAYMQQVADATIAAADAQRAYNDAVVKYGPASKQAKAASQDYQAAQAELAAQTQGLTDDQKQAQQQLADDEYQITVDRLQKQADAEQTALDAQKQRQEQAFQTGLQSLETQISSGKLTGAEAEAKTKTFMQRFGLDFGEMGDLLGSSFTTALQNATKSVDTLADALRKKIEAALKLLRDLQDANAAVAAAGGGGVKSAAAPAPAPMVQASLLGAPASAAAGGTLYGVKTPAMRLDDALMSAISRQAAPEPAPTVVRVFIGDTELKGLVRSEVQASDQATARALLAGGRGLR
jgi:TP901 family phage tail tape measure protein